MLDDKKSVGVLFRQVKEAHKQHLIAEYRFHESLYVEHNPANTICLWLMFRDKTTDKQFRRVVEYIKEHFRAIHISYHDRRPMDPREITIVFSLVPLEELPTQSI
jgi:spore coat polysaccharide biosynthesis protein SpsF (cytidylyltransferase family)